MARSRRQRKTQRVGVVTHLLVLAVAVALLVLLDARPTGKAPADFPSMPPHQFYGSAACSAQGTTLPDGLQIRAVTTHETTLANYTLNTTTNITSSRYGYAPALFLVEGAANGDNITFFVGSENVYSAAFSSAALDEVNVTLASSCVEANVCGNGA